MNATAAPTRKCRRCAGTGMTGFGHVEGGVCFGCKGEGVVARDMRTPEQKRAEMTGFVRRNALVAALNDYATQTFGVGSDEACFTAWGRDHLEQADPTRHAKLLDSVEAGRLESVIAALVTYYQGIAK